MEMTPQMGPYLIIPDPSLVTVKRNSGPKSRINNSDVDEVDEAEDEGNEGVDEQGGDTNGERKRKAKPAGRRHSLPSRLYTEKAGTVQSP